jgi:hypothetical protein
MKAPAPLKKWRAMRGLSLPLTLVLVAFAGLLSLAVGLLYGTYYTNSVPTADDQTASKPNFVFILADDMRYDDLAYMPKTRNLLGSQGMTFSKAYVAKPLCCPSRTSILTGMYTHNHKVCLTPAPTRVVGKASRLRGMSRTTWLPTYTAQGTGLGSSASTSKTTPL